MGVKKSIGFAAENEVEIIKNKLKKCRLAQGDYAKFTQEQVDKIFLAVAMAANQNRLPLAKMAFEETKMGVVEDKVIKNHYAAEYIYNAYRDEKTCGVIEENKQAGIKKIAEPIGVISAIIPTTNPTSTTIFKCLIALKTRNGIVISPHPRAKKSTIAAASIIKEAAEKAGAPKNLICWVENPSLELTNLVMKESDLILATGGPGLVKAAYSSGKPAIGVGAGNTPVVIDSTADIRIAVNSIIHSKTFDNGMICASEQSVTILHDVYDEVMDEFKKRGCYIIHSEDTIDIEKLRKIMFNDGALNAGIVGQSAINIAKMAGINVPEFTKILIVESSELDSEDVFSHEKLSPVLTVYKAINFEHAVANADYLVNFGGPGHTSSIYVDVSEKEKLEKFESKMKTGRILVNTPASHGGIGDIYNFELQPSLTLGCGSWGGNIVSENVGVKNLLNIKTVAERRENMLWFRTPDKLYFKKGCMPVALDELSSDLGKKKAFIVTDNFLYKNNYLKDLTNKLNELGINYTTFYDVEPDPTIESAKKGADAMLKFEPDVIIAFGGGSAMDAAKIMWLIYEHPDVDFMDTAMRFMDIRKRVYKFPKLGEKAYFVAIPTTSGTGSEVTPFSVITDGENGIKYPIADYELLPDMAIIDADNMMSQPKSLTAASGIDALTHAIEGYASIMASDYTDGMALNAIKNIFEYLPTAYENGSNIKAREKMANASTIAGMVFANAFLGVCHSMAHKLGSYFHLPHGIANALLITEVMQFNAASIPTKMGTFSQYEYPKALERYAEIADFLGISGKNDTEKLEKLIEKIDELKEKIDIKSSIKEYGVNESDFKEKIDSMTEEAFDDQCTGSNPRYPLMDEIKEMYKKVYYGA